jgi:hypothetical protein
MFILLENILKLVKRRKISCMERKLVGIRNEMIKNVRYDKIIKFIPKN